MNMNYNEHFRRVEEQKREAIERMEREQEKQHRREQENHDRRMREAQEKKHRSEIERAQRLAASGKTSVEYAIDKIIEKRLLTDKDPIDVSLLDICYPNTIQALKDMHGLLKKLKDANAVGHFERVGNEAFYIGNINIELMRKFKSNFQRTTGGSASHTAGDKQRRRIMSDGQGGFLWNEQEITVNRNTDYFKIFESLFYLNDPANQCVEYQDIEKRLRSKHKMEERTDRQMRERIQNALTNKSMGFFYYAKVEDMRLRDLLPNGKPMVRTVKGNGIEFVNPVIE